MRYIKLLALLALCTSCGIKGKIIGDRYYDPSGWYSVELPVRKPKITETINEDVHSLTLDSSFGMIHCVDIMNGNEETFQVINAAINGGNSETLNKRILNSFFQGPRRQYKCRICESGPVTDPYCGSAYFALLEVKEGSSFRNLQTNKAKDDYAALLIFIDNSKVVVLSFVFDSLPFHCLTDNEIDYSKLKAAYLEKLIKFRKNYTSK